MQWLVAVVVLAMALAIPGPCSYDGHKELDCRNGDRCPQDLVCAADGHCKNADIACDGFSPTAFPGGAVSCAGVCIARDSFKEDEQNCGTCGVACADGQACCGGACVTLDSDAHCGACDVVCGAGQSCIEAKCAASCGGDADCDATERCCGERCLDATVDTRCGACDVQCSASEACIEETCTAICTSDADCPGAHCCGQHCTAADDAGNCGGCNVTCEAHQVCLSDACAGECDVDRPCADGSKTCCNGACVDTDVDDANCGGCDQPCVGALFCHGGTCHDGTERDCCGTGCTNCKATNDRCTSSGTCAACNMFAQDCGPGASCGPFLPQRSPPAGICLDATPPPAPGRNEQCNKALAPEACGEGFDCQQVNADIDMCAVYCDSTNPTECVAAEGCLPFTGVSGNLGVCVPTCDPVNRSCAINGLAGTCLPASLGACVGASAGMCAVAGPVQKGATCASFADCALGLVCTGSCEELCNGAGTPCASGGTCTNVFGCTEVGVCR